MIGYGFIGAVHSHAWRAVSRAFELGASPFMSVICGSPQNDGALQTLAGRYGWASMSTDWKAVVKREDIDIVDICTPSDTHMVIAISALRAGKHVLCEKPLARSVAECEAMTKAAEEARSAGQRAMVGFNYRCLPALALARQLVAEGRLGTLRHVRGLYLQDWLVDPNVPLSWRLVRENAGSGALGDIGSHVIDLAQFLTGDRITALSALMRTFVTERPLPAEGLAAFLSGEGGEGRGPVTVDDATIILAEMGGGALATFEATRMATGRKNALRIELNGSDGSVAFDFEAMNELWFCDGRDDNRTNGFRRILATERSHPYLDGWWPPGHGLGYDHAFVNEIANFVRAVVEGTDPEPGFSEGLQIQRVLAAVESSAAEGARWTAVESG
jgi:predicted dehydrogenase